MFEPVVVAVRSLHTDIQVVMSLVQVDILIRLAEVVVLTAIAKRLYAKQ